jgi:Na+-transporting NADH:ubiquinone oxidoreductase subunit C
VADFDKDGLKNVLLVAIGVCFVCSIVVSTAAVMLKPQQLVNQELDRKQNILRAAGVLPANANVDAEGRGVDALFAEFTAHAVNLETGEIVESVDISSIDPIKAARKPDLSRPLSKAEDIAVLGRRENISIVYIRRDAAGEFDKVVIPVRGYGLWGTLFGYLAVEGDLTTVAGLGFYSHKETPGLGGEVDNLAWRAQWPGVALFDAQGRPAVSLVKTRSAPDAAAARHEIDALAGATMTSRGVANLIEFWTSELGFGAFFKQLKTAGL